MGDLTESHAGERYPRSRYRWIVLAVGITAQGSTATYFQGLPAVGPALRDEYRLGLSQLGILLGLVPLGLTCALLVWGMAADRFGERTVMTLGLLGASVALFAASRVAEAATLGCWLFAAGVMGASVNAASGRAVVSWFPRVQRGFAMGLRQTALPVGAAVSAFALPPIAGVAGVGAALAILAGICLASAVAAGALVREPPTRLEPSPLPDHARPVPSPLKDPVIGKLAVVSALLIFPQFAIVAFLVLFLHGALGLSPESAALWLGAVQLGGAVARILVGGWSDRVASRLRPLRLVAIVVAGGFATVAILANSPGPWLYCSLAFTSLAAICWNGLAFTATAELAGPRRSGTALGLQNTVISAAAAAAPPTLAAIVAAAGWSAGFFLVSALALAAAGALGPLAIEEERRRPRPIDIPSA